MTDRTLLASEFANSFNRKWREGIDDDLVSMCYQSADKYLSYDAQQKSEQVESGDNWLMIVPNIATVINVNVSAIDSNTISLTGDSLSLPIGVSVARYHLNDIRLVEKL